jgi:hypothetical protein
MRTDIFLERKCVHIKLEKDTHAALRAKLFRHNITMQDLFEECAALVASDTAKGQSLVESIVKKKIKEIIDGKKRKRKSIQITDADNETLYSMINDESKKIHE